MKVAPMHRGGFSLPPALTRSVHCCVRTAPRVDGSHVQVAPSVPLGPLHLRDRGFGKLL
jgi:hypothetical protein